MKKVITVKNLTYIVLFTILFFLCLNLFIEDKNKRKIEFSKDNIHVLINNKNWTSSNVELTIKYDGNSTKDIDSFSFDGGKTWTKSNLYIVEQSGIINMLIKDVLGRIYEASYAVDNIDKDGPEIINEKDIMVYQYSKFNVDDYIKVIDTASGLDKVKIKDEINTDKLGTQKFKVEAIDKLGNKSKKTIKVKIIQKGKKVKPNIIECSKDIISIKKNKTKKIKINVYPRIATVKNLKYKSDDDNIISVDKNGIIKGKKIGKTKVYITSENRKKTYCSIIVSD